MPETLTATTHVGITRLAGQIGAEITGADAGTPLSDEVIARIRQALLDHKVVFLRNQSLNYRRQVAFAERLGPLTLGHPGSGARGVHLHRLRDRAPAGAGAPGDQRAVARARRFRPHRAGFHPRRRRGT